MNWYYVVEGKSVGPIADEAFQNLVSANVVAMDTLVWNDQMTDWKPYREVAPASQRIKLRQPGEMLAATASEGVCASCGNLFSKSDMIQLEDKLVCARCKPLFVQRMMEGLGATGGPVDADALTREILARDYQIDIGASISRGWELVKSNFWPMIGITVLVYLALMASGSVPYVGPIIQMILQGPIMAGLFWFFLCAIRGREAGISEAFSGFGPRFVQAMLAHVVSSIIVMVLFVPGIACAVTALVLAMDSLNNIESVGQFLQAVGPLFFVGMALIVVAMLIAYYLYVAWFFALPLVMDKGLDFWPALQTSRRVVSLHWWKMFALLLTLGLMAFVSMLLCCLPVLVALPVVAAATMFVYEDIFNPTT